MHKQFTINSENCNIKALYNLENKQRRIPIDVLQIEKKKKEAQGNSSVHVLLYS